jgi:hypothetical protein
MKNKKDVLDVCAIIMGIGILFLVLLAMIKETGNDTNYAAGTCVRKPEAVGRGDNFYPSELIVEVLENDYIFCFGRLDEKTWDNCHLVAKRVYNNSSLFVPIECPNYELVDFEWKKK